MLYFDTSYLVRLYFGDPGWKEVRTLAQTGHLACCFHGYAETVGAFHRKLREHSINQEGFNEILQQFEVDCAAMAYRWLPFSPAVNARILEAFKTLPAKVHLRAADAMHLACAAENGFREIYSNDSHLLAAASHFDLKGVDIIP